MARQRKPRRRRGQTTNSLRVGGDLAKRFESRNAGTKVMIDKVPSKAVVETLPVQLAAGESHA